MSLKAIKTKILSVKKTRKVTKAMEAVSAVKMRKSQEKALSGRPYARAALELSRRLADSPMFARHPFIEPRASVTRAHLCVIATDKGLCGGLNTNLFKKVHAYLKKNGWSKDGVTLTVFGRKARDHFSSHGFTITRYFPMPDEVEDIALLHDLVRTIAREYLQGNYDKVVLCYTRFRSTFEQEAVAHALLPLRADILEETVSGILPERGKYADLAANGNGTTPPFYRVEPDDETVLAALIPRLLQVVWYHALLESSASEHSARMVSMKNASDKAAEVVRSLTLTFNKARQAAITQEVSEIVGGMQVTAR